MKKRPCSLIFFLGLGIFLLQTFVLRFNDMPGLVLTCASALMIVFGGFFTCVYSEKFRKILAALAEIFGFLP